MHNFQYTLTKHAQKRIDERGISLEWIERVLFSPALVEADPDDQALRHAFGVIPEYGSRVLRVIYNQTTDPWTIVSVHFDRRMKGRL